MLSTSGCGCENVDVFTVKSSCCDRRSGGSTTQSTRSASDTAGELEISGGDQVETASYFETDEFRFPGPEGFETHYVGLTNEFKSIRAAFDDRSIRRVIIIVESDYIACQT
jgi:hypothetical protein